jgi:hypothetical protein
MAMTESVTDVLRPRLLTIPDYQRGYSWEADHVRDFLDDLTLLEPGQKHYTGTVVLLPSGFPLVDDESNSLAKADVVDGQQRLTTICLLLNELRRALHSLGKEAAAAGLRRQFLVVTKDGAPIHKLQVGSDALPTWGALLHDKPVPPPSSLSGERLLCAAKLLRRHVDELVEQASDPVVELQRVRDRLITGLHFTLYQLNDQAEVGVIFETLNDRGKPLTELEKAKNYLLFLAARLPDARRKVLASQINEAWTAVYRLLLEVASATPVQEDQFLRAHWLASVNPVPVEWKGIKSIKGRFPRNRYVGNPELLVIEVGAYVETLARAARAYADSLRPDAQAFAEFGGLAGQAREIHDRLARARTVALFQPLMIALRERRPEDGQAYCEALDLCLRFAVRTYLIGGYRADAGQTRLYRLAFQVFDQGLSPADLSRGLRLLAREYADDGYVRQALLDTEYNWYRWRSLTFFFYEYELHLLRGAVPELAYSYFEQARQKKTIEHILPQTPNDYWTARFDKDERRRLTHALGNLVLTRDNSAYSNKSFPEKRGEAGPGVPARVCYAQAPLAQEQQLAHLHDWTPTEVIARQERLAEWALGHWSIDFRDLEPVESVQLDDLEPDGAPLAGDEQDGDPGFAS